ncbi:mannose-binding protein-like [Empidonax traillii]|uniref:mannose-binding protein-like n=1 Tax=Empidonax traillii TaxID=164674 RepID=UPI000FFCF4BC|nr:mannose-binding protein-like [Empidonax traillii]
MSAQGQAKSKGLTPTVSYAALVNKGGEAEQVQPEEKIYSWAEIQCSAPAVNGSPGRDGPKGAKREPGEEFRGVESFPGKVGPPGIKGALGPQRKKGEKGEYGTLILKNIKSIAKNHTCLNWKSLCTKAVSALASPRNEAKNTDVQGFVTP